MRTWRKHIVIIGGGFGGLHVARGLRKVDADITVIDRENHHLFQPLLYQVATASLSPRDIAAPLRRILRKQRNTRVILGDVQNIDVNQRRLQLVDGDTITFDYLVVAAGAGHSWFGNDQWAKFAPGLKNIHDALEIRKRVLLAFENAERASDPAEVQAWLTFVVVGSGPTGVELAGALGEMAQLSFRGDFRRIQPEQARVLLVDVADRVLPPYAPELSAKAAEALRGLGVQVETGARVINITDQAITLARTDGEVSVPTHTVVWAAGIKASPLATTLATQTGATLDRLGRVHVNADLTLPGHPEIFALGDNAHYDWQDGEPVPDALPAIAPVAMQQGDYVAKVIGQRLEGHVPAAFHFSDRGSLATIGRNAAVGTIFGVRISGYPAWLAWLFIHLMYLVGFENRLLVFFQWFWNYITFHRGARLIVDGDPAASALASHPGGAHQIVEPQENVQGASLPRRDAGAGSLRALKVEGHIA